MSVLARNVVALQMVPLKQNFFVKKLHDLIDALKVSRMRKIPVPMFPKLLKTFLTGLPDD
jgi:hypothetical protein